jgi:PAS domain S-box-containing protein
MHSFLKRLLRRIPMPFLAVFVGLAVGFGVWKVIDPLQSQALRDLFDEQLRNEVEQRARESLVRFERFVAEFSSKAQLLGANRHLAAHLDRGPWKGEPAGDGLPSIAPLPPWLDGLTRWAAEARVQRVLLFDAGGQLREDYPLTAPEALSPALRELNATDLVARPGARVAFLRTPEGPVLVVPHEIEDSRGNPAGFLALVVPVDSGFLVAAQQGAVGTDVATALVDPDEQWVVASSNVQSLRPGTAMKKARSSFEVTVESLADYGASDWTPLFATFVPREGAKSTVRALLHLERQQRLIMALVLITVFSALFALVSGRLNRVLRRITEFSRRALGADAPPPQRGNQLLILEDRIRQLIGLVLAAREAMRAQHETEIQESEAIRAAIMASSLDAIVTIDDTGRILDFNPTAERQFGHPEHEVVGQDVMPLMFGPGSRGEFRRLLDRCREPGDRRESGIRAELTAVHGDGSAFPVEVSIKPFELHDRLLFAVYLRDISERKRQEEEIRSLAAFPSESPSPVLRVDPHGVVLYANAASETLLGRWGCRLGQQLPAFWQLQVRAALEDGRNREQEMECAGRIYSLLLAPIAELGYVNIYARDVTDARAAEEQSRKHQTELVHVCRLSTMGEMATGIAHELNQPLAAVVNYAHGCARRIRAGTGDSRDLLPALEQIAAQATRAGEIIKRLRVMTGKKPPVRAEADLNDLVREVCGFIDFEIRRLDVVLELELADVPLPVRVDVVQMEQVILNLLRNAIDAVAEQGPERERRVTIRTGVNPHGDARVVVEDTGGGIEPAHMAHLFDPFYTTKDSGMGMGLSISQTIVADHNGKIRAESRPGEGAAFVVELPASPAQTETRSIAV